MDDEMKNPDGKPQKEQPKHQPKQRQTHRLTLEEKRKLFSNREELRRVLANADAYLAMVRAELIEGDFGEERFNELCGQATQLTIVRARLTSLEVMK